MKPHHASDGATVYHGDCRRQTVTEIPDELVGKATWAVAAQMEAQAGRPHSPHGKPMRYARAVLVAVLPDVRRAVAEEIAAEFARQWDTPFDVEYVKDAARIAREVGDRP